MRWRSRVRPSDAESRSCSWTSRISRRWPRPSIPRRCAASSRATSRWPDPSWRATAGRSRSSSVMPSWRCGEPRSPTRTTRSGRCAPRWPSWTGLDASEAQPPERTSRLEQPSRPARRRSRSAPTGRAWLPATWSTSPHGFRVRRSPAGCWSIRRLASSPRRRPITRLPARSPSRAAQRRWSRIVRPRERPGSGGRAVRTPAPSSVVSESCASSSVSSTASPRIASAGWCRSPESRGSGRAGWRGSSASTSTP